MVCGFWVVLCTTLPGSASDVRSSHLLVDRFLKEAPVAWKAYKAFSVVEARCSSRQVDRSTGGVLSERTFRIKKSYARFSDVWEQTRPYYVSGAIVLNPEYSFTVKKSHPEGQWAISVTPHQIPSDFADESKPPGIFAFPQIWFGSNRLLPEDIPEKEFAPKNASLVREGTKELVRIEFDYNPVRGDRLKDKGVKSGWLLLDPSQHWTLIEYEVTFAEGDLSATSHSTFEFNEISPGLPIIKRELQVLRGTRTGGSAVHLETQHEWTFTPGRAADFEFTLSAFGLPEPTPWTPLFSYRFYLWAALGLVAAAALAVLFKRLSRRFQERAATENQGLPGL